MRAEIEQARMSGDLDKALSLINEAQKSEGGLSIGIGQQYALTLMAGGKHGDALEILLLCVSKAPHEPQLWLNVAQCAEAIGDWEAALRAYDACLKIKQPNPAAAHIGRGSNLFRLGMNQWGREAWEKGIQTDTTEGPSFQKSQVLLAFGEWESGWREYEGRRSLEGWRVGVGAHGVAMHHLPDEWDGKSLGRVLVYGEQGAGDILMFSRYLPFVEMASGHFPAIVGGRDLDSYWPAKLLWTNKCEWAIPIGSLPLVLGIPEPMPIPPHHVLWTQRNNPKPRVGVCWKGSPYHTNDKDRSSPINFRDAFQDERWEIVSLQCGYGFNPKDYLETAELMRTLDAVVTVDTSNAHLAGTIGVPTILIPPAAPEWRWSFGDTTPWYPSMKIVRRKRVDLWDDAIARAKKTLVEIVK